MLRLITVLIILCPNSALARINNPLIFIGESVRGGTAGDPLFIDANNLVTSGEPTTTYFKNTTTLTTTSTTFVNMTDLVTGSLTGTYQVWCRTSVTHTTNNADIFMAVGVATTNVADSISQARPFIQGGVTPSLGVPMVLDTFSEVVVSAQVISCMWRTSAGTATSTNSHGMIVRRVR